MKKLIFTLFFFMACPLPAHPLTVGEVMCLFKEKMKVGDVQFNTTSTNKKNHYLDLIKSFGYPPITFIHATIVEPAATIETIARYKASHTPHDFVLIEDTSIVIEGRKDSGIHIKSFLQTLKKKPQIIASILGKKVTIRVWIAFKYRETIIASEGVIHGKIISHPPPADSITHLASLIIPNGAQGTYADLKELCFDPKFSARALAFRNLMNNKVRLLTPLYHWDGQFQQ